MQMVEWSDMLYLIADKVALELNGLPRETVLSYLQRATAETAKKTDALVVNKYISLQRGMTSYPLEFEDEMLLHKILKMQWCDGSKIDGVLHSRSDRCDSQNGLRVLDNGWIDVGHCPDCDEENAIVIRAAVFPSSKACGVYEDFFERASELISSWAMYSIYLTDTPLYNPASSRQERRVWTQGCTSLRSLVSDGHQSGRAKRIDKARYSRRLR